MILVSCESCVNLCESSVCVSLLSAQLGAQELLVEVTSYLCSMLSVAGYIVEKI